MTIHPGLQQDAERQSPPADGARTSFPPRSYQKDLIDIAAENNVIISLATSAGKTLIAAEVIRRKLPALKAATKAVLFMAPTNPLVAQQADVALHQTYGFRTKAYHGSVHHSHIRQWDRQRWIDLLQEVDVLVMTPDVLLHTLSHGVFKMSDIGLLIFDEAHHCKSDHPYNQLMQDFYHPLPASCRPQVLGLTASPEGMEQDMRKRANKARAVNMGLQHNMNAWLVTVPAQGPLREELDRVVPRPTTHFVTYTHSQSSVGVINDSLSWLNWTKEHLLRPAKRCEVICEMLRAQELLVQVGMCESRSMASFETFTEGGRVAALDKQIRGVIYCLEHLGPWCAAAAAYLDLLAPPTTAEEDAAAEEQAAMEAAGNVWQGAEDEDPNPVLVQGGDTCRVFEDELGGPPEMLLAELRNHLSGIVQFLQLHADQPGLAVIVTQAEIDEALTPRRQDLPAIAAASAAAAAKAASAMGALTSDPAVVQAAADAAAQEVTHAELEWCARGLLKLAAKVSLLITMNVLADVLVDDMDLKKQLMDEAAGDPSCRHLEQLSSGSLQGFAEILLRRVPFSLLEAQVWPHSAKAGLAHTWNGPPLLTEKVVKLLRLLRSDRQRCLEDEAALQSAATAMDPTQVQPQEGWWASMVFVETKLSALVLSKLLSSLPTMRRHLRSGYLLGDTRSDKTGSLTMNNKQQALVVQGFRSSTINVLIATSVGSEGMDFRQCQLVVAFDLPKDVTSYIQCRGRARKRGSRYCFMQAKDLPHSIHHILMAADQLEIRAMEIAAANRTMLEQREPGGEPFVPRPAPEVEDPVTRLSTPCGAAVTTRLAQKMLADYCGKLPGCDRATILQPYYSTRVEDGKFHTIVYLPSNCGIGSKVEGAPPAITSRASKQQAALHALRLLYQAGKLNDHLQPVWITQGHSKQLEAEVTPQAVCHIRLRRPFQPCQLSTAWTTQQLGAAAAGAAAGAQGQQQQQQQQQRQAGTSSSSAAAAAAAADSQAVSTEPSITLHLHTFVYGKVAQKGAARHQPHANGTTAVAGSNLHTPPAAAAAAAADSVADAFSTALGSAEAALMAAVVGTDEALAALPGGPVVCGGMDGAPVSKLCFGVLLWEPLAMEDVMKWPVWIEKQLYIMDVVYEGPVQLSESQVSTLLGYQNPLNKFINWNTTRTKWLKAARAEEAAVIAEAPLRVDLRVTAQGTIQLQLQVWEPLPPAADTAAAGAGADANASKEAATGADAGTSAGNGPAAAAANLAAGPAAGTSRQASAAMEVDGEQPSAAAAAAEGQSDGAAAPPPLTPQEQLARQPLAFKPRLLEELVRFKRVQGPSSSSNNSNNSVAAAGSGGGGEDSMQVDNAPAAAEGADQQQQQQQDHSAAAAAEAAYLQEASDDWQPPGSISYLIVPLKNAADSSSSNSNSSKAGLEDPQHIPPEAYPRLNIAAAGLDPSWTPAIDWGKVLHMGEGVVSLSALVANALGLQQQQTQTPERMVLPPTVPPPAVPDAVFAAAAAAGQPQLLAGAATMTALPAELQPEAVSKLEAALRGRILVAGHSSQVYSALGVAAGLTPSSSLREAVATVVERYGMAGKVAEMQNDLAMFAPLLARDNPEMAAAVMLSANLAEKDPEQRPMLGWKVGKTDEGKPIWESTDRHDDYYRLRFGVTGLRPDIPMLAVKSSRGLTDCCLLPPRVEASAILGPKPEQQQQQQQQEAVSPGSVDRVTPTSAAAAAVGSKRPLQQGTADTSTPDKRRLVQHQQQQQQGTGTPAAAAALDADFNIQKVDRLATWEHQQQQRDHFNGLTQAQLDEAGKRLAAMSSSARRKAWAQHRVMFLPLELGWVLPLTSPEWSQLQLVPNCVYRIDSMLQASCMHKQLRELLRGGGPEAATKVFNYPLPPSPDDEATAQEMGWLPPAPVKSLLADYTITVDLPPLFDDTQMAAPDSPTATGTAAAAAEGGEVEETARVANGHAAAPAAEAASGAVGRSSLPNGLAARMHPAATPGQVRKDVVTAAAAASSKRGRSPTGADSNCVGAAAAAAAGSTGGASAASQQDQQLQLPQPAMKLTSVAENATSSPSSSAAAVAPATPAAKKPESAATAALAESTKALAPGQQPPTAAKLLTVAERKAQLASVPLPSRSLVLMALTCASCHEAFDFERLEFLGDVVLKALAAHIMLGAMPADANEGELSVAKAQVVRNVRLARLARSKPLLLQYQLRIHPFDNCLWTPNGCDSVLGLFDDGPKTTFKGKRLADGIESLIGAFYLTGAAAEAARNTAAAAAGDSRPRGSATTAAVGAVGLDSEIYGVEEPSVPAMLDAASWVWHRVSQPGLEAAAALCEVLEVLPQGALELIRRSPMQLTLSPPDKPGRTLRATASAAAAAAAAAGSQSSLLSRQLTEKLVAKMSTLMGGPFPYSFWDPSWLVQSLTHVSVLGGVSYQRLEFLGDALMDLIVSLRLLAMGHGTQRHHGPAELTKARASAVANLTMAKASVLAGLHQVLRCNSWRLLYTTHKFAQETIAKHAQANPDWKPYHTEEELAVLQQQQQQQGVAAGGQPGSNAASVAAGSGGSSRDVEMTDANGSNDQQQQQQSGNQKGKWGSAAAVIAATAAAAVAASENCSLVQLAPLAPLGPVGAAELEQRLSAPCLDDDTIWLAVWLRKKELAALQAVAAEVEAVKAGGRSPGGGPAADPSGSSGPGGNSLRLGCGPDEIQMDGSGGGSGAGDEGEEGEGNDGEGEQGGWGGSTTKPPKKKCPKVMADLVESLVAAVFVDSGCDWASTWEAAEYLLWREGVVELPPVNLPEDPAAVAAAAVAAKMAAAEAAAAAVEAAATDAAAEGQMVE